MFGKFLLRIAAVALAVTPLAAQNTDIEALAGLQFNFSNPGARALGMGGAFLGLADDASAAEANPAGLTILRKTEVSLEGRNFRNAQKVFTSGSFPNLQEEEFSSFSRNVELSFASVVVPIKDFAIAAYYHQPISYDNGAAVLPQYDNRGRLIRQVPNFYLTRGNPTGTGTTVSRRECETLRNADPSSCFEIVTLPFLSAVSVALKTAGISGAWKIGSFSLGAGVRYQQFRETALTTRYFDNGGDLQISSVVVQGTLNDDGDVQYEEDLTGIAGFKWEITEKVSVGGSYKQGPSFSAPVFKKDFLADRFLQDQDVKFHAPDVAGLGISVRPLSALTVNADAVYVTYSNLTDDFRAANTAIAILENPYESKDVVEYHAGAEYFFTTKIPIAIRAGWWRDPAHSIEYVGPTTCNDQRVRPEDRLLCSAIRVNQSILFPAGEDQNHFSIGVGLSWPRFQLDAAYETSSRFKVGSLSMVTRF